MDIVSGEPLFSSHDKYDSGSGWPSFTGRSIPKMSWRNKIAVFSRCARRSEANWEIPIWDMFSGWPPPTGLRYCMNSAALRFIPKEDLEKEGYGEYMKDFSQRYPLRGYRAGKMN